MTEKHLDRTFAEFLVPKFISHYCDNCHEPIEDEEETAEFVEHLPSSYMRTKTYHRVCIECIPEVIHFKPWNLRTVIQITNDLAPIVARNKAIAQKLWEDVYDKNPGRVKHI